MPKKVSHLRQTRMMSTAIGSFAADFGVATEISDFTGWELMIEGQTSSRHDGVLNNSAWRY
ncbi:MAG TPA: hypothetical protein VNH11_12190 [Pirellulales bacterium]|nr:hypothetical protein [Pirellulales bacterium]